MSKTTRTVLVTGGAGFLGSHLCERLLVDGHDVVCLDNLVTGRKDNIQHLLSDSKFEFIRHDVCFPIYLEVDMIFNLACPASPVHYQRDPVQTIKTNVIGMINLLGLAKRTRATIIQASTSEVYGDPELHPQPEEYWGNVNPIGLRACYDEGKRAAETLCFDYRRQHNMDVKVIRIFNTFGPRMAVGDGRVVSNFIVNALQNEPLMVHGSGRQTRSLCYVNDLIDGFMRLSDTEEGFAGPVNIGGSDEMTVTDLAMKIIRLTESSSVINTVAGVEDDPRRRRPDLSLARNALDWSPSTSVDDGLLRTIEYFRTVLSA